MSCTITITITITASQPITIIVLMLISTLKHTLTQTYIHTYNLHIYLYRCWYRCRPWKSGCWKCKLMIFMIFIGRCRILYVVSCMLYVLFLCNSEAVMAYGYSYIMWFRFHCVCCCQIIPISSARALESLPCWYSSAITSLTHHFANP